MWVLEGQLPQGAPAPQVDHAGPQSGTWEERHKAVVARAELLLATYQHLFTSVERRSEPAVPRAFELRNEILTSLGEIVRAVQELDNEEGPRGWN
jgi:hypothetical protein